MGVDCDVVMGEPMMITARHKTIGGENREGLIWGVRHVTSGEGDIVQLGRYLGEGGLPLQRGDR